MQTRLEDDENMVPPVLPGEPSHPSPVLSMYTDRVSISRTQHIEFQRWCAGLVPQWTTQYSSVLCVLAPLVSVSRVNTCQEAQRPRGKRPIKSIKVWVLPLTCLGSWLFCFCLCQSKSVCKTNGMAWRYCGGLSSLPSPHVNIDAFLNDVLAKADAY